MKGISAIDRDKLMEACETGEIPQIAEALRRCPAAINARDELGWTPLIHAAIAVQTEVMDFLIEKGADISLRDNHGYTAADQAVRLGYGPIADRLAEALAGQERRRQEKQCAEGIAQFSKGLPKRLTLARKPLQLKR